MTNKGYGSGYVPRAEQAPLETKITEGANAGDVKREHPAFGMIGASRWVGGGHQLFGSPIRHRSGVTITIKQACEQGDEYTWRSFAGAMVAEVHLSEAQWASFVTAMNIGDGIPCTLSYYREGEMTRVPAIVDIHPIERQKNMIKQKAEKDLALLLEFAAKFKALLESPGTPSKTALRELYNKYILHAVEYAPGAYQFQADQVSTHLEKTVVAARSEIEGYILNQALRFPGIVNAAPEIPKLEPPKGE